MNWYEFALTASAVLAAAAFVLLFAIFLLADVVFRTDRQIGLASDLTMFLLTSSVLVGSIANCVQKLLEIGT